ncbi:hypothetical protein LLH23_16330 [bacterium]|nr:hypothetical protein [bacterium]
MRDLDPRDLFVWLGKIFYGMLYRDLFLPLDVTGQKPGRIASRTLLQAFRTHHLFLQCVRVPMDFPGFFPASVLVVHTQEPQDIRFRWDFRDNYATMFIGCRLGSVGIVAALQDGGAQQQLFASLGVKRLKLHPLQFTELMAQVLYKARLFNRVPKYVTIDTDPKTVVQASLQGLSSKPVFDEWNPSHYAQILSQLTGFRLENVFLPPDAVMSWLRNSDRRLRKMPLEQYPIELLYGV